jgi:hypothetical protein
MWPCKRELDEEKSKHIGLAQTNGFRPALLQRMLRLVNGWIGSCGLLLLVSHLFAVPVSLLWVGLKKQKTELECEKYFCRVTY